MPMPTVDYADLTYPEVAALPRDATLVIPLGAGPYDLQDAGERLKAETLVVLPAIPYGFPGPGLGGILDDLGVGRGIFRRVLLGVQRELTKQGFTSVTLLDAHNVRALLSTDAFHLLESGFGTPQRAETSSPSSSAIPADLAGRIVVVSVGHTEQHGLHLPCSTDTRIVRAIAEGVESATPDSVVCLPTWPYGVSTHTRQFPGTLNLGGRVFEDFFLAVVARLIQLKAEMIFFSNAHGGNHSFLVNIVKYAGEQWPGAFVATEFLHTTGPELQALRSTQQGGMGHGCELETSYLLHLRPDLVHMDRARPETDFISTPNFYMDWIEGGRLIANPPWTDDTVTGLYGDPTSATPEKGALWLQAAVADKVELLKEVRDQHTRRKAHRAGQPMA
jgi:creatinine amidohydrolase